VYLHMARGALHATLTQDAVEPGARRSACPLRNAYPFIKSSTLGIQVRGDGHHNRALRLVISCDVQRYRERDDRRRRRCPEVLARIRSMTSCSSSL
jgi:hypothetical protein